MVNLFKILTLKDWLHSRGGRTIEEDLHEDENGKFVWMGNGAWEYVKVYLPSKYK